MSELLLKVDSGLGLKLRLSPNLKGTQNFTSELLIDRRQELIFFITPVTCAK